MNLSEELKNNFKKEARDFQIQFFLAEFNFLQNILITILASITLVATFKFNYFDSIFLAISFLIGLFTLIFIITYIKKNIDQQAKSLTFAIKYMNGDFLKEEFEKQKKELERSAPRGIDVSKYAISGLYSTLGMLFFSFLINNYVFDIYFRFLIFISISCFVYYFSIYIFLDKK